MQLLGNLLTRVKKTNLQSPLVTKTPVQKGDFKSGQGVCGFALEEVDIYKRGNHFTSKIATKL